VVFVTPGWIRSYSSHYYWRQIFILVVMPSVLWYCWLGSRKGTWPVKTEWWDAGMVMCLGQGADSHVAQPMPLPLNISCSNPDWFYLSGAGSHQQSRTKSKRAIKQLCVCVCVCVCMCVWVCVVMSHDGLWIAQVMTRC